MKFHIHESIAPLLRGIGLTIVLIGTIAGAVQAKGHANASHRVPAPAFTAQSNALEILTREVEGLRQTVQEESLVEDVLVNPWFDVLGIIGSGITAASFYVEWASRRSKRDASDTRA